MNTNYYSGTLSAYCENIPEEVKIPDISSLYHSTNSLPTYNIKNQYVVLNPESCEGYFSLENVINDEPIGEITNISNGGHCDNVYIFTQ